MDSMAWTAVISSDGRYTLGMAERDQPGYIPMRESAAVYFESYAEASIEAEERNRLMGLTDDEAMKIVISSMRNRLARSS